MTQIVTPIKDHRTVFAATLGLPGAEVRPFRNVNWVAI